MSDDHQPQQQESQYPFFSPTEEGLRRLHQEFGRLFHQSVEVEILATERAKALLAARDQIATWQPKVAEIEANHGDGKCVPAVAAGEVVEMRSVAKARGG